MNRAVPATIITLVGLGALAAFHTSPTSATIHSSAKASAAPTPKTSPTTAAPPPDDNPGTAPATNPPATNPPATTPPTTTPPTQTGAVRTIDGDTVDNRYGPVQVRVTMRGNTITAITALQMPQDRERSAYISQQAEPYLQQEALQAQSAQIDIVSGATYTSESYAQSLQSALDKAHG